MIVLYLQVWPSGSIAKGVQRGALDNSGGRCSRKAGRDHRLMVFCDMNRLFVLSYLCIIEIKRSYKIVILISLFALIASNAQARNKDYSVFVILISSIIAILITLGMVAVIRYRYALQYWPDISVKIKEARGIQGRVEVAKYVSGKVDFKK